MNIHDELYTTRGVGGVLRVIADGFDDDTANRVFLGVGTATSSTAGVSLDAKQARALRDTLNAFLAEVGDPKIAPFAIDIESPGEAPEGVWPESWRDLLAAIFVARASGSVGTRSETLIEGRGRQAFKAVRHPSQPSVFHVDQED